MKSLLADTPKVQLRKAECSALVQMAEALIAAQKAFWTLYKGWIQQRVHVHFDDGHGTRKLQTIFPAVVDANNQTFNDQIDAIRNRNFANLVCHNPTAHLNPEKIMGLEQLWIDINRTLSQVGTASTNFVDKGAVVVRVLTEDIDNVKPPSGSCEIS